MSYKAGVIGAAGFAGIEACRILLQHPDFELVAATSDAQVGEKLSQAYPAFEGKCDLEFISSDSASLLELDVAFLAVPHTAAIKHAPKLIDAGVTVIDLSADFRLKDPDVYEKYYATKHTQTELLANAAFGLPELFAESLEKAKSQKAAGGTPLVGCAGCYPTATSLAAAPAIRKGLVDDGSKVVVDAISGVTGAGKKASQRTHFCFANENLEAYGVSTHRHTPEIEQILNINDRLIFTPHLAPLNRGLLSTVTMQASSNIALSSTDDLVQMYKDFYSGSFFVKVEETGIQPNTSAVVGTNFAHVGAVFDKRTNSIIATCAIDNLCKGAAGQAIQCANIVFGLPESAGLDYCALPV